MGLTHIAVLKYKAAQLSGFYFYYYDYDKERLL